MQESTFYYIGIDPGLGGAFSVLTEQDAKIIDAKVYAVPIIKTKATKTSKAKNEYNIHEIAKVLNDYKNKQVFVCIESVTAMPNQGTVSMFHFGEGFGIWKGIIGTLGFQMRLVRPQTWKNFWPDDLLKKIEKPELLKLKTREVNKLSAEGRKKYKETQIEYKKNLDSAKKLAKDHARELAKKLYPELADSFMLKKDDGKAEAVLIAEYIRRNWNVNG